MRARLTPCHLVDQLVLVELGHQLPVALHQRLKPQPYQALLLHGCPQASFEAPQLAKAMLPFSARHREHSQTLQDSIGIRVGILSAHEDGLVHGVSWLRLPLTLILEKRSNTTITG